MKGAQSSSFCYYIYTMKNITTFINERQLGQGWKELSKNGFSAQLLSFDEPNEEYGIDGGRISKLYIRRGNKVVCNYDRGWDVEPTHEVKAFYDEIIKKYN